MTTEICSVEGDLSFFILYDELQIPTQFKQKETKL